MCDDLHVEPLPEDAYPPPFEPVTLAELDALAERYFPSNPPEKQPHVVKQGRASVTNRRKPICPVCKQPFVKGATRQKYCSRSCQQRAYRQRKTTVVTKTSHTT